MTGTSAVPIVNVSTTYGGGTSIATLGTVTQGTWNADVIGLNKGGTNNNLSLSVSGSIIYSNGSALLATGAGTTGYVLTSAGSGQPTWSAPATVTLVTGGTGITVVNGTTTPQVSVSAGYTGGSNIATVGTITNGTWHGTVLELGYGGTGVALTAKSGGIVYSSSSSLGIIDAGSPGMVLTSNGTSLPYWTVPTTGTLTGISAGSGITVTGSSPVPTVSVSTTYGGGTSIATLGTVTQGTWNASTIGLSKGGTNADLSTGVAANALIWMNSGQTALAGMAMSASSVLTTNSSSIPSWTSILTVANGGTGQSSLTAHALLVGNGASLVSLLAPTSTAGQILTCKGSSMDPGWTTAVYPTTIAANKILYANAQDSIQGLTTNPSGVLITNASSIPSIAQGTTTTNNTSQVLQYSWNTTASLGWGNTLTQNKYVVTDSSGNLSTATGLTLPVGSGGTGQATLTQYGILMGNGATAVTVIGPTTAGYVLTCNGSSLAPTWNVSSVTGGIKGQVLTSNGPGNAGVWQNAVGLYDFVATNINTTYNISYGGTNPVTVVMDYSSTATGYVVLPNTSGIPNGVTYTMNNEIRRTQRTYYCTVCCQMCKR